MLERLGISEQVNAKTRFPPAGGPVGDILARSPELQIVTDYLAAIPKDSVHPDAGKSLLSFLRSPEGVLLLREGGLDPR